MKVFEIEIEKRTEELKEEIKQNIKLYKYEITENCMELLHTLWDDSDEFYYNETSRGPGFKNLTIF